MRTRRKSYCRDVQVYAWSQLLDRPQTSPGKIDLFVFLACKGRQTRQADKNALPFSVYKIVSSGFTEKYRKHLEQLLLEQPHTAGVSVKENWRVVNQCIVSAAEETTRLV